VLLALDTATATVGVAVHHGGELLARVTRQDDRRHGELLAPALSQALAEAGAETGDLTDVVCGVGPGPFTGLRVGVVTARVLALTQGLSARGVCSLDAIAEHGVRTGVVTGDFLVATDARRKEVYWARYAVSDHGARRTSGPEVARAADLSDELRSLPCLGRGAELYPDSLAGPGVHHVAGGLRDDDLRDDDLRDDDLRDHGLRDVDPAALAALAARALSGGDADGVLLPPDPLYLRRPDAAVPGPLKQALTPALERRSAP
jgi:tRNA threonylcarbamoyl adenosine modification protein YeaZ